MNPADSANLRSQKRKAQRASGAPARPADEERREKGAAGDNGRATKPTQKREVVEEFVDEPDPFDGMDDERDPRQMEEGSFEEIPAPPPRTRSAEHRPPQRVADEFGNLVAPGEDTDLEEASPEEIQRETERWAPKTVRDTVVDTGIEKICRVCGKNLKGHRRYKDEKGYICVDCDRDERSRRIPCAECGKLVTPEALRPWGPIAICARCWADHESDPKLRIKRKVSSRPWEELEKKTVIAMSALALLALFVLFIISLF